MITFSRLSQGVPLFPQKKPFSEALSVTFHIGTFEGTAVLSAATSTFLRMSFETIFGPTVLALLEDVPGNILALYQQRDESRRNGAGIENYGSSRKRIWCFMPRR